MTLDTNKHPFMGKSLNIMCWNARGIMTSTPYLAQCLKTHNVDICGISEHWLRECNLCYLDSIDNQYTGFGKAVTETDPERYNCNQRGGVAILYRKNIEWCIKELNIDDDRIIGVQINFSDLTCLTVF